MHKMLWRITLLMMFLLGAQTVVWSQNMNVDRISATVVQGEQWAQVFLSTEFLNIIYDEQNGTLSTENGSGDDDIYFAKFTPSKEFLGTQRFAVEYVDFFGQKRYTEVEVKVVKSLITTKKDFIYIDIGETSGTVDVLSNDQKTDKSFEIIDLGPVIHGRAEWDDNQRVTFFPNLGFSGTTSFLYTVKDSQGTTATGKVIVNVARSKPQSGSTYLTVVNTSTLDLILPGKGFYLSRDFEMVHGNLEELSDFSYQYNPNDFSEGVDVLKFVNAEGVTHFFEIEVINNQKEIDFVIDDKIYTLEGEYVSFDARGNDYSKEGYIVDFSRELIYGSGVFAYHPPPGFTGVKNFYYTVHDGFKAHKGNISIFVGNYLPQKANYDMVTQQNTPLVLEYQVPVDDFSFKIISPPSNGNVVVNQTVYSDPGDCGTVKGFEMIVYDPVKDYVGTDQFEIEYCTDQGKCKRVEIQMTVQASTDDCNCIGPDCVWAGDTNNDGKVSVLDLLPIGYHYGESGNPRRAISSDWMAHEAEDWLFNQKEAPVNTKYADTDGNGIIDQNDVSALYNNYESYHNLVPQEVLAVKDFPIVYSMANQTVKPGDLLEIEVSVGTDNFPVLDIQGLAFSIQVPPTFVQEGSMTFTFSENSFFMYDAPSLSIIEQPGSRGRLDVAVVRVDGSAISGKGKLGSVGLIAMEEIDGFRPESGVLPIKITTEESIVSDGNGNFYRIEGGELIINLELSTAEDDKSDILPEVIVFPNPSQGIINFHANNRDSLQDVEIYDVLGKRVYSEYNINQRGRALNLDLNPGMYVAHIVTQKGKTVNKFQVLRK